METLKRYRRSLIVTASAVAVYALLGFFLAPWLVNGIAVKAVRESTGADLRLGKVVINPFVLSLRVDKLELDDPARDAFARIDEIFVNFQLSSLFRWAWTFAEFRINAPQLYLSRDDEGALNLARFGASRGTPHPPPASESNAASTPRLLVLAFAINEGVLHWDDEAPVEPVHTRFGPISIAVNDLNTLPERPGDQSVAITTEATGTLSWSGTLELNPLQSSGRASINGSHFPLISSYIRNSIGFDILEGDADADFAYSISALPDEGLRASVDNFNLELHDVSVTTYRDDDDRKVLALPQFRLSGGAFRWPERTVSVASLAIDDAALDIYRDAAGKLNILPPRKEPPPARSDDVEPDKPRGENPWTVALGNLAINRLAIDLEDQSVQPAAALGISSLDLAVDNISNSAGAVFPTRLSATFQSGGTLELNGETMVLPAFDANYRVDVARLAIAGAHPYIASAADVNIDSGEINLSGQLRHTTDEPLSFDGNVDVLNFLVTETDEGTKLGSWDRLGIDKLALSLGSKSLQISELRLDKPYGDIVIAEDGSLNLLRIGTDENGDTEAAAPVAGTDKPASPMSVTVGRVVVNSGAANFADLSLPLPFVAKIEELNGSMSTIATESNQPSTVAFEGKVDEFGFVSIGGHVTPLSPYVDTNLKVEFQNVDMPKFSAYTIPFAGREISSGRLDVNLGYKVKASQLEGENKVVLRDFELGDKVPHPGAMSLPLGLAVALLKDPEGKIDIELPVRGDVSDPEFSYGRVVFKALGNLIVNIVASPFALLGKLVGVEANELEYIEFVAGRSDLTPPELEKAAKIAEALGLRPQLKLEVAGVVDREVDGLALRAARVDTIIEEQIATLASSDGDAAMYAGQRLRVIETIYREQYPGDDIKAALDALRLQFTAEMTGEDGKPAGSQFDSLAYANTLREQLIERQPLGEEDLVALAKARAGNALEAVVSHNSELAGRVVLGKLTAVEAKDDAVQMKVTLSAD